MGTCGITLKQPIAPPHAGRRGRALRLETNWVEGTGTDRAFLIGSAKRRYPHRHTILQIPTTGVERRSRLFLRGTVR